MERHGRAPVGTFFSAAQWTDADRTFQLGDSAAHHARVKRLSVDDPIQLSDGSGRLAAASIVSLDKHVLTVAIHETLNIPRPPAIHVRVAVADRDRMLWLAEKATELGISTWQAVRFRRSASVSSRGEGEAFGSKLRSRMVAALEQSGGAWLPRVLEDESLSSVAELGGQSAFVLDRAGAGLAATAGGAKDPVVLVGPEGGIEDDEMELLIRKGWRRVSLAPTTLRFETAGVAAIAVLRAMAI